MKTFALLLCLALPVLAQRRAADTRAEESSDRSRTNLVRAQPAANPPSAPYVDETPAMTHHEMQGGGRTL